MKYIKKFDTIEEAINSEGNLSPNISWVGGSTNPNGIVLTYFGKDTEIKFIDNGGYVTTKEVSPLTFTAEEAGSTVKLTKSGSPRSISLQYSTDKKTWNDYTIDLTITLLNVGDKIYFKGDNPNGIGNDSINYYLFNMSGKIAASGTITSLIDSTCKRTDIPYVDCYYRMFYGCTSLTSAPELPATTLKDYCYGYMFYGCASLTSAPELPATRLRAGCYESMFFGCTKLSRVDIAATYIYISANYCLSGWLSGVSSTGDFYCDPSTTFPSGASGIPSGWTRHPYSE